MPWQETDPMFERHHFAQDLASGQWTMTECHLSSRLYSAPKVTRCFG